MPIRLDIGSIAQGYRAAEQDQQKADAAKQTAALQDLRIQAAKGEVENQPQKLADDAALRKQQLELGSVRNDMSHTSLEMQRRKAQEMVDEKQGDDLTKELIRQYSYDENGAPRDPAQTIKLMAEDPLIRANPHAFKPFVDYAVASSKQLGLMGRYSDSASVLKSVGALPQDFDVNKPEDQKRLQLYLSNKNAEALMIDQTVKANNLQFASNEQIRVHGAAAAAQAQRDAAHWQTLLDLSAQKGNTATTNAHIRHGDGPPYATGQAPGAAAPAGPLSTVLGTPPATAQRSAIGSGTSLSLSQGVSTGMSAPADPMRIPDVSVIPAEQKGPAIYSLDRAAADFGQGLNDIGTGTINGLRALGGGGPDPDPDMVQMLRNQ